MELRFFILQLFWIVSVNKWNFTTSAQATFFGQKYFTIPQSRLGTFVGKLTDVEIRLEFQTALEACELLALRLDAAYMAMKLEYDNIQLVARNVHANFTDAWSFPIPFPVNDVNRHRIVVTLNGGIPRVSVDETMCQTEHLGLTFDGSSTLPLSDGMSIGGFKHDGRYFRGCVTMLELNKFDLLKAYRDLLESSFKENCSHLFTSHSSSAAMVIPPMGNIKFNLNSERLNEVTRATSLQFKLRSNESSALIFHLMENLGAVELSRHILLKIDDGVLTLLECLEGRLTAYLKSNAPIDDGRWHFISIAVTASSLWLMVGEEAVQWISRGSEELQNNATEQGQLELTFGDSNEAHASACSKEKLTLRRRSLMCIQGARWGDTVLNFLNAVSSSSVTIDCPPCLDRSKNASCMSLDNATANGVSTARSDKLLVTVDEGGEVCLNLLYFKSVLDAFPVGESLLFTMFNPPAHGRVYKLQNGIKIPVLQFTTKDLLYHRIFYTHDGSELRQDEMEFEIESEQGYKAFIRNAPLVVILINVNPVNDPPRVVLPSGRTLHLLQHSRVKLTKEIITVHDMDTEPANIDIYVQQQQTPHSVYIVHEKFPGEPITHFSWQNILSEEISIVHMAGWTANITFHVVDNHRQGSLVKLNVQVHRARIKRLRKAVLELSRRTSALVTMTSLDPHRRARSNCKCPIPSGFLLTNLHRPTYEAGGYAIRTAPMGNTTTTRRRIFKSIPFTMIAQRKATLQRKHLFAWTFPNPVLPEDITYEIVRAPLYGFLTKTIVRPSEQWNRRLGVYSKFTQADIDMDRLTYELRHSHYSVAYDHFQFTVTALDSVTTPCRFFIAYIPENEHLMLVNRTVVVKEGKSKVLSNLTLSTTMNRFANFQYRVVSESKRGRIIVKRENGPSNSTAAVTTFSTKDINEGLVWYKHDGSESRQDKVYMAVSPLIQNNVVEDRIQLPFWLHIRILPSGDSPPKRMNSIEHVCYVTRLEEKVLTTDDLWYVDKDGDSNSRFLLYHFPEETREGAFYTTKLPGISIHVFSQHDINSRQISYVHTADNKLYKIPFRVTDGNHVIEDMLVVNATEPFFTIRTAEQLKLNCGRLMPIRLAQFAITTNLNFDYSDIIFTTSQQGEGGHIVIETDGQSSSQIDQFTMEDLANEHVYYKCSRKVDYPHWTPLLVSFDHYSIPVSLHIAPKTGPLETDRAIYITENGVKRLSAENVRLETHLTKNSYCATHFKVIGRPENGSLALGRYAKFQTADIVGMDRFHVDSFTWYDIEHERLHYVHRMGAGKTDTIIFNVSSPCSAFQSSTLALSIFARPSVSLKVTDLIVTRLSRVLLTPDNVHIESDFHGLESDMAIAVFAQPSYGRLVIEKQGKYDFHINRFHEGDLKFGHVWYVHENGSSDRDEFSLLVVLRNYTIHSAPFFLFAYVR